MKAGSQPKNYLTDYILDEILCPVARMRLLSDGMNENNRLLAYETVIGDKACLSCGNCVDACPVVTEKHGFIYLPNQRTSMALEHMVGLECRRCYRCIQSCPQVDKPMKEYAAGFRRGEKIIHILVAVSIVLLALSGMTLTHYRYILPSLEIFVLDFTHRVTGVILMALPFLYFMLDRKHLTRWLKKVFLWKRIDMNARNFETGFFQTSAGLDPPLGLTIIFQLCPNDLTFINCEHPVFIAFCYCLINNNER